MDHSEQATTSAPAAPAPPTGGDTGSGATFPRLNQQQLAVLEQMASDLVESSLNEALEIHLRAQVHATADETMRAAFAAATGGGQHSSSYEREFVSEKTTYIESSQPSVGSSSKKQRRRRGNIGSQGAPADSHIVALGALACERYARAEVPSCARAAAPLGATARANPDPNLCALSWLCCAARRGRDVNVTSRRRRRRRRIAQTQFEDCDDKKTTKGNGKKEAIECGKGWQKCSTACQTSADLNSKRLESREGWKCGRFRLKFKDRRGVPARGGKQLTLCPFACLGNGNGNDVKVDKQQQQRTCHIVTDVCKLTKLTKRAPSEPKFADQKAEVTNGLSSGDDDHELEDDDAQEARNLIPSRPVMQSEWLFCDKKRAVNGPQEVGAVASSDLEGRRQACQLECSTAQADIEIVCARARARAMRQGALISANAHGANLLEALGARTAQRNCAIGARAYAITSSGEVKRIRKQQQRHSQVDCHKILSARQSISVGEEKWRIALEASQEWIHFYVTSSREGRRQQRRKSAPTSTRSHIPVLIKSTPTQQKQQQGNESRSQVRRCESVRRERAPGESREARIREFSESLNLGEQISLNERIGSKSSSLKSLFNTRRSTSSTPSAANSLYLTAHDSTQLSTSQSFHNCKSTLDDDDDQYLTPVFERKLVEDLEEEFPVEEEEDNLKTPTNEMVSLVNAEKEEPAGVPEVPSNLEVEERRPSTSGEQLLLPLKSRRNHKVTSGGEDDAMMASAIEQELAMDDTMDEEQVKRILACKRLSEGCNRFVSSGTGAANYICRKNSLHMQDSALIMAGGLPPVTEGEPMRHMSHHLSQNLESTSSSGSISSASFGLRSCGGGGGVGGAGANFRHAPSKRNSQDDNATSCSSSTSLDGSAGGSGGGPRSPSRRRSSTVSQCSSVLSEGTRQQLNFDLSPDLAPDSSILDANALSPTGDSDGRPASPEPIESPISLSGACSPFDMRAISRMSSSQCCDDLICHLRSISTPDSMTQGDNSNNNQLACTQLTKSPIDQDDGNANDAVNSETTTTTTTISNNDDALERIISHVSAVKVSNGQGPPEVERANGSQKRAHTPFGANLQRNKATHVSPPTPSPTAPPESAVNRK